MRIAYHTTGSALTKYALDAWLAASIAAIGSVSAPGALVIISDPKHPYCWGTEIIADDRTTLGGAQYSKVNASVRRGILQFQTIPEADLATWTAWHLATLGGRVPFVIELPHNVGAVAVTARIPRVAELTAYKRWQPTTLELMEYLP